MALPSLFFDGQSFVDKAPQFIFLKGLQRNSCGFFQTKFFWLVVGETFLEQELPVFPARDLFYRGTKGVKCDLRFFSIAPDDSSNSIRGRRARRMAIRRSYMIVIQNWGCKSSMIHAGCCKILRLNTGFISPPRGTAHVKSKLYCNCVRPQYLLRNLSSEQLVSTTKILSLSYVRPAN